MRASWVGLLAVVAVVLSAGVARAETAVYGRAYVFETVDAYEPVSVNSTWGVTVTGILQGEATPRVITFSIPWTNASIPTDRCERPILLAMTKPGRYLLQLTATDSSYRALYCKLTRR